MAEDQNQDQESPDQSPAQPVVGYAGNRGFQFRQFAAANGMLNRVNRQRALAGVQATQQQQTEE